MLCEKCGKNAATTHIRSVVNGVARETHLCSICAANEGIGTVDGGFDNMLASMFGDALTLSSPNDEARCKCCGSTFSDIAKNGKAGCPECYTTFYNEFLPYIKRVHGSVKHIGKRLNLTEEKPVNSGDTVAQLKEKLRDLIREEKFEEAAQIRDRIKELEAEK